MPEWVIQCPANTVSITMTDGRVIPVRASDWTARVWAEYPANIIFNSGEAVAGITVTAPAPETTPTGD